MVGPLYARMAEEIGFRVLFATGAGIANEAYGLPDLGVIGLREMLDVTTRIVRSSSLPVIADIDTGYGGTLNVVHTVREFALAGVAAVQIEDQTHPKRCGHFAGKQVVSTGEMLERLAAADEARGGSDLVILARTDALALEDFDSAMERVRRYVAAGADAVFVEAPTTMEELRRIPGEVPAPLVVNMVEGGRTPIVPTAELNEMGYRIALYANSALRSAMAATRKVLESLHATGGTAEVVDQLVPWADRQAAVDLEGWLALDDEISSRASGFAASGS
ncbi:oxaloacetate decarboxylase [Nocardioides bigeumensis]|uniref:Oxaloacetate decarboxylase n=1 Tax=Nocardioides bigeumensis TaxID=433657 RepID=A0ABN2YA06_9ACTN